MDISQQTRTIPMPRLTKIYTRTGDEGYTSLADERISKDDLLLEALGTIDELNSSIGFILSQQLSQDDIKISLTKIQNDLFDLGGEMHVPQHVVITADKVTHLEELLDGWNEKLPPLKEFILPGGNIKSAACHMARTVCRRAERCLVRLHRRVSLNNPEMLRYLNRLSDVLFVIARVLAREDNSEEKMWTHQK